MKLPRSRHALSHRAIDRGTAAAFAFFGDPRAATFAWHRHRKHQLMTVTHGLAYVQTATGIVTLTPWCGLLLPAGVRHETRVEADCRYRSVFFDPRRHRLAGAAPLAIATDGLVASMIEHCAAWRGADHDTPRARRFFAALWDVTLGASRSPEALPVPEKLPPAWRDTLAFVLQQLAHVDLPAAAARHGQPPRTFRRNFHAAFGCDWRRYLRSLRLTRALQLLESGRLNVSEAAQAVGFGSLSAFNAAFRAVHGRNPSAARGPR